MTDKKYLSPTDYYSSDDYIDKNPSLHEEDSDWKVKMIWPYVENICDRLKRKEIIVLDVGGGAGKILSDVCYKIEQKYNLRIKKTILDLSQKMLDLQLKNNSGSQVLKKDIRSTNLPNKSVDLVLMIDVIEHVPKPEKAMKEIARISDFVIFKVPLEDNLILKLLNLITLGRFREEKTLGVNGHINTYNIKTLTEEIENHCGQIIEYEYTNAHEYFLKSKDYQRRNTFVHRLTYFFGNILYKLHPAISAKVGKATVKNHS